MEKLKLNVSDGIPQEHSIFTSFGVFYIRDFCIYSNVSSGLKWARIIWKKFSHVLPCTNQSLAIFEI